MKKAMLITLALILAVMPLSACKKNSDEYSIISVWEDGESGNNNKDKNTDNSKATDSNNSSASGSNKDNSKGSGSGKTNTSGSNKGDDKVIVSGKTDFGGQTFTMAVTAEPQYNTTSFQSMIASFEKKYNCKINKQTLTFNDYNKQINQQMSTGKSYDICYMHGSQFPSAPIAGLYSDMTQALNSVKTDSINKDKSKELFTWNGKLYGVVGNNSAYPVIMYYNKVMFEDAGLEDPRELYDAGKWTWDKIFEMGNQVTDPDSGVYFLAKEFVQTNLYGESSIYIDSATGKVVNNLRSANVIKSFQLLQKIYSGSNPIGYPSPTEDYLTYFSKGKCYMLTQESSKYEDIAPLAKKSMSFNKKAENIGIVPLPLPAENTQKLYPTGWYTAIAAGAGSDTTVALLWANHRASYVSPVKGNNEMSDADKKLCNTLMSGPTLMNRHGQYSTAGAATDKLYQSAVISIMGGGDIAKVTADISQQIDACIEATVGKGNYISK